LIKMKALLRSDMSFAFGIWSLKGSWK